MGVQNDLLLLFESDAVDFAASVLATNPTVFLPMDETAGTVAADATGNGYTGMYTSVSLAATTTPIGTPAGRWDAINDKMTASSTFSGLGTFMDEGAFMLWLNADSFASISYLVDLNISGTQRMQFITTGGNLQAGYRTSSGSGNAVIPAASLSTDTWYRIIVSWINDGVGNTLYIYQDGVLIDSDTISATAPTNAMSYAGFGTPRNEANFYDGSMALFAYWTAHVAPGDARLGLITP